MRLPARKESLQKSISNGKKILLTAAETNSNLISFGRLSIFFPIECSSQASTNRSVTALTGKKQEKILQRGLYERLYRLPLFLRD